MAPAQAPAWRRARDWDDYRHQAALRLLALNPDTSYGGVVPQPALAIPVLEIGRASCRERVFGYV